jgi:acetyl esterase/lipase
MFRKPSQPLHESDPVLSRARLDPYFIEDGEAFACVLVLPGGGYAQLTRHEGPPVAGWLNSMGISAVVLKYSVSSDEGPGTFPRPQQQALYAIRWMRANAADLNIDPKRIGVMGFSAGGHLAACLAHGFDRSDWLLDPDAALGGISARPDASILAYAVLSASLPHAHQGSMKNLLGEGVDAALQETLSWEKNIHPDAPPTFLWHTAEDGTVRVENSYEMAIALQKANRPHELHVFPKGDHGIGLASIDKRRQGAAEQWRTLAERWLREIGF